MRAGGRNGDAWDFNHQREFVRGSGFGCSGKRRDNVGRRLELRFRSDKRRRVWRHRRVNDSSLCDSRRGQLPRLQRQRERRHARRDDDQLPGTAVMRGIILLLAAALASAANIGVSVETTPTQAVLAYRPTPNPTASCTISLSNSAGAIPDDVNPALFANANVDTAHVVVNNGGLRKLTLGIRAAQLAQDGCMHSRAYQAASVYSGSVACNGGTDTGSFRFQTQTPSLGNSAPDPPPFDANGFGNFAWPTVDFTDQSKSYVDPQTGVLLKRFTNGLSNVYKNGTTPAYAFDLAGAWTTPNNILG